MATERLISFSTEAETLARAADQLPLAEIDQIGLVGQGDVVQKKIWPAIQQLGRRLAGVAVASAEPATRLTGSLPHQYFPVQPDGSLPLAALEAAGFLSRRTLWVVATPPKAHLSPALALAKHSRVAIEKPLTPTAREAQALLAAPSAGGVYPIDHKLFNASALAAVEALRQDPSLLRHVRRVEAIFDEADGFAHGRQQEDGIGDILSHVFNILGALFAAPARALSVSLCNVWVSKHSPDGEERFQTPEVDTAARARGRLRWAGGDAEYDVRQVKGAPRNEKWLRLLGGQGELLREVDLNESGSAAHGRVLESLLAPEPDMRLTLGIAQRVLELIEAARQEAKTLPKYQFGQRPDFPPFRPLSPAQWGGWGPAPQPLADMPLAVMAAKEEEPA